MAEWEERCDVESLIVAVSNVQALSVDYFQVLTWPVVIRWVVFQSSWEGSL